VTIVFLMLIILSKIDLPQIFKTRIVQLIDFYFFKFYQTNYFKNKIFVK
jgi:hypothetical protein